MSPVKGERPPPPPVPARKHEHGPDIVGEPDIKHRKKDIEDLPPVKPSRVSSPDKPPVKSKSEERSLTEGNLQHKLEKSWYLATIPHKEADTNVPLDNPEEGIENSPKDHTTGGSNGSPQLPEQGPVGGGGQNQSSAVIGNSTGEALS